MKYSLQLGIVVMTLCGVAASASAGQGNRRQKLKFIENPNQSQTDQSQNQRPAWTKIGTTFGTLNNNGNNNSDKKKKHPQLDPGRPDGRVETPDMVAKPASRPGYVFVNGHWEREKATSTIRPSWNAPVNMNGSNTATLHTATIQLNPGRPDGRVETADVTSLTTPTGPHFTRPGYVFVNGHWERAKAYGAGTIVTPPNVEIRDHRTDGPLKTPKDPNAMSGGVSVTPTITTESLVGQTVYGTGPGLHSLWDLIRSTPAELEESRDHRTPKKSTK